jgi:hypothetical protein
VICSFDEKKQRRTCSIESGHGNEKKRWHLSSLFRDKGGQGGQGIQGRKPLRGSG